MVLSAQAQSEEFQPGSEAATGDGVIKVIGAVLGFGDGVVDGAVVGWAISPVAHDTLCCAACSARGTSDGLR
jgi:hypothetical protein